MKVQGEIRVPGDKSVSHRALMLAALADGRSRVRGILRSDDVQHTAGVLRALGTEVPQLSDEVIIEGRGRRGLMPSTVPLDCGNSGTTTRLMAGICAAFPFASTFVGDASLSRRPMRRVAEPLRAMGAEVDLTVGDGLPMTVHGDVLRALNWVSETASAQVKSAILLAGVVAGVPVVVREPARSRDHTERMLRAAGVEVDSIATVVRLEPTERLYPLDLVVPGDPSSAAFLAALGVLADEGGLAIRDVGLNPTRIGFFHAMQRMGARLELQAAAPQGGEEVGHVLAWPSALHAITIEPRDVPSMIDELPLLACVAARAEGRTEITGAGELRVKESDRIAAVVANLQAIGVDAEERRDGLTVVGSRHPLRGRVQTFGDHRIAMAFGVLRALDGNDIVLDNATCVEVSYPEFWRDVERLRNAA